MRLAFSVFTLLLPITADLVEGQVIEGREEFTIPVANGIDSLAVSNDKSLLATAGCRMGRNNILLWDLKKKEHVRTIGIPSNNVVSLFFSKESATVTAVFGSKKIEGAEVHTWETASGKLVKEQSYADCVPRKVSPDGKYLVSFGSAKSKKPIEIFDLASGKRMITLDEYEDQPNSVRHSVCCSGVTHCW